MKWKTRVFKILLLCTPIFLSGCDMILLDSKGQIGLSERNLIITSACLMLLVVVPVILLTFIFAYKYRASNLDATYTPNWDSSHKVELVVWSVPCLIVLALSVICWKSTHELDPAKPIQSSIAPMEIDVVALDWKWLFIYPELHIATVNQVVFPVNVPVRFEITSESVMNAFFIPQLGSQIYAMAGMDSRLNLIANEIGSYDGMSANFSGPGFSGMHFKALATSKPDFDKWVAEVQLSQNKLAAGTYRDLTKPSEDNPVQYYSAVDPGLFGDIIGKYMKMPMNTGMNMKTSMNSTIQGAANVR